MIDWRHWHNEPLLIGGLIFIGWLYAVLTVSSRNSRRRPRAIRFYAALVIFYLAVGSPLDQIGERFLLSAHMVQHQLIIYAAAPLFLSGLPWEIFDELKFASFLRPLSNPVVCAFIYVLTLTIWHAPALYEAALEDKRIHIAEHIMFFGAALFYWMPVLSQSRRIPALGAGGKILYLLAVSIAMTPVFAFVAFSGNVLYPMYEYAPRIVPALTPSEDQLLSAGIMKLTDIAVLISVSAVIFYRWYKVEAASCRFSEETEKRRDAASTL